MTQNNLADIRREYGACSLNDNQMPQNPLDQFKLWFDDILQHKKIDPTAMVLSTVDEHGHPDSRVVLLKHITEQHFIFYTNYQSTKAQQIAHTPFVALNFYWEQMARQVRIRGIIEKLSEAQSDAYFATRPLNSQFSTLISLQSQVIPNRAGLEEALNDLIQNYDQKPIARPAYWGGYQVAPTEIEFWQGRDNRLHDRIHYYQKDKTWRHQRLAP